MAVDIVHAFLSNRGVRKPKLAVLPYRHDPNFKFVVDLRAFNKGRRFFRTRGEAETFAQTQKDALARHGREALGLSRRELAEIMEARNRLARYGATIAQAAEFFIQHYPARKRN